MPDTRYRQGNSSPVTVRTVAEAARRLAGALPADPADDGPIGVVSVDVRTLVDAAFPRQYVVGQDISADLEPAFLEAVASQRATITQAPTMFTREQLAASIESDYLGDTTDSTWALITGTAE